MKRTIVVDHDCNRCCRQGCKGDTLKDRRGSIRSYQRCPGQVKPSEMRTSLLERASENPGTWTALNVILDSMKLIYCENYRYPYFDIRPR